MDHLTGTAGLFERRSRWPVPRRAPAVVVLAGIERSDIVDAALADPALSETLLPRFEPSCAPPCDAVLWRLETAAGEPLNRPGAIGRLWHRPPYALTLRLVRYQPGSTEPLLLDEGTIGTRGSKAAFQSSAARLAMRFVRDAALGRARGPSGSAPAPAPHGPPGWLDHARARWRARLLTEWWSLGTAGATVGDLLAGRGPGPVTWYGPEPGTHYLADPFPWPGTGKVLAEEMPVAGGTGRIVAVTEANGVLSAPLSVLDDGRHHSYPCTFRDSGATWCVPEAPDRGATRICRLGDDGVLVPVCDPAPHDRLADPTLFRWNGRYWLACTDLEFGPHDNLCLMHADSLAGPWTRHARWPVKIDVRGARPAGSPLRANGRLYRPAQDCAATYGAGVALWEVTALSATDFAETLVAELRPDPAGPFPHGLHTLTYDGERFWVDGKRFVMDRGLVLRKLRARRARRAAGAPSGEAG